SWIISARLAMPNAATVAYRLMPDVHAVPIAKLNASIVPINWLLFRRSIGPLSTLTFGYEQLLLSAPRAKKSSLDFVLAGNLVFEIFAKCIDGRELVEPFERPAGVDQDAVTRVAARRALLRRQRWLAHRGPYALDNVQILTHVATRSDRPDDIGWIGDVDIVVDDDNELA